MTAQAEARHVDFDLSPDTMGNGPRRRAPSTGAIQSPADGAAGSDVNSSSDMENILERVMTRLDENDRRYGAALDGLQSRLSKVSSRAGQARPAVDPATQAALERVENHAAQLSRDVKHAAAAPHLDQDDAFRSIEEKISDFSLRMDSGREPRRASPSAPPTGRSAPPPPPPNLRRPAPRAEAAAQEQPSLDIPPRARPERDPAPSAAGAMFSSAAARLEESLSTRAPSAGLEAINQRMDELAQRLDEALARSPDAASIQRIETQLSEIVPYFSTLQDQHQRLEAVEEHLHGLVEWLKTSQGQVENAARQAAEEVVRLMPQPEAAAGHGGQQLESIQYELRALNERAERMDERTVRALETMTESMHLLAQRLDEPAAARMQREEPRAWTQPARDQDGQPRGTDDIEVRVSTSGAQDHAQGAYDEPRDLDALGASIPDYQPLHKNAPPVLDEPPMAGKAAAAEPRPVETLDEDDDFIAAARRAARSAAAKSTPPEERGGSLFRRRGREKAQPAAPAYPEYERQPRARPFFVGTAILLLCVSAYLFYERLKSKQDEAPPPAPQQSAPAPVPAPEPLPRKSSEALIPREQASLPDPAPGALARSFETPARLERPQAVAVHPAPEAKESDRLGFEASVVDRKAFQAPENARIAAEMFGVPAPEAPSGAPETQDDRLPGATVRIEEPVRAAAQKPSTEQRVAAALAKPAAVSSVPAGSMPPATIGPESLRHAAARGNPAAQFEIGARYAKGSGVPVDMERAAQWFGRAAAQGLAPAQFRLASLHERGQGVEADAGKARVWYERAAQQGHVKAMHNLAVMLSGGNASTADYAAAAAWFQRAAQLGLTDSQFNLGILYEAGLGVQKNAAEAYRWFSTAAARGDKEAEKRREQVRTQLSGKMLQQLDQFLAQWRPDQPDVAVNEVRPPEGGWSAAAAGKTTPEAGEDLVASAQKLLNTLGYDAGVPDGVLGPQTISAIRRFETRSGLQGSGNVTPELLARLKALSS